MNRLFCLVLLLTLLPAPWVGAEETIPDQPSAPPSLFKKVPPETFHCERFFIYEGKTYGCDSDVRPDGEGLRAILQDTPAAASALNAYQKGRSSLQNTAYIGSLGILVLIAGAVGGGGTGKQIMLLSGTAIFGGAFLYGFTSLKANEANLNRAVELHNQAVPDKPIQLQFSTGITF